MFKTLASYVLPVTCLLVFWAAAHPDTRVRIAAILALNAASGWFTPRLYNDHRRELLAEFCKDIGALAPPLRPMPLHHQIGLASIFTLWTIAGAWAMSIDALSTPWGTVYDEWARWAMLGAQTPFGMLVGRVMDRLAIYDACAQAQRVARRQGRVHQAVLQ